MLNRPSDTDGNVTLPPSRAFLDARREGPPSWSVIDRADAGAPEGRSESPETPSPASRWTDLVRVVTAARQNRFVRFLAVGGLNTCFSYAVYTLLILAGIHYAVAGGVTTVVSLVFSFNTIGRLVFASRDPSLILRFTSVYAIIYVIGTAITGLAKHLGVPVLLTTALLLLPMAGLGFVLNRWIVFRK